MQRAHWWGVFTWKCGTLNLTSDPGLSQHPISMEPLLQKFSCCFPELEAIVSPESRSTFSLAIVSINKVSPTAESPLIGETTGSPLISSTIDASTQSNLMFRTRDFGHTEQNGTNDQLPSGLSIHIPRYPLLIIQVFFPSPVEPPS